MSIQNQFNLYGDYEYIIRHTFRISWLDKTPIKFRIRNVIYEILMKNTPTDNLIKNCKLCQRCILRWKFAQNRFTKKLSIPVTSILSEDQRDKGQTSTTIILPDLFWTI